jgi:hypothetical protein
MPAPAIILGPEPKLSDLVFMLAHGLRIQYLGHIFKWK